MCPRQVATYALHHSKQIWDDPEAFQPERWLADEPAGADRASPVSVTASALPTANGKAHDAGTNGKAPEANGKAHSAETIGKVPDVGAGWSVKWMTSKGGKVEARKAAFLPFSGGPIDCLGQRLALMEVRGISESC